ncbi:MAG: hypothetical protein M1815_000284 [Lichina confinis]|nr:MAG: hypothetical protein M1815_000284 [Lichina confinis]
MQLNGGMRGDPASLLGTSRARVSASAKQQEATGYAVENSPVGVGVTMGMGTAMGIETGTSGALQSAVCSKSPTIFVDEDSRLPGAPITVCNSTTFLHGPTGTELQQHLPSSENERKKKRYRLAEEYHVTGSPTGSLSDKENWDPETSTEAQSSGEDSPPPSRPEMPSYASCPEGSVKPPALSNITPRRFSGPASLGRKDKAGADRVAVPPLSPRVEIYRKERRPKRNRCPSYFDCDILPCLSPARASARATPTGTLTGTGSEGVIHQNHVSSAVGTSPDTPDFADDHEDPFQSSPHSRR